MKESSVELRLKTRLESFGFKVLKLTCPGTNGAPDRMLIGPKGTRCGPWFVECKAPSKNERRLQELVRDEWRIRGLRVLDICDSYDRVEEIVTTLREEALHSD